MRWTLATLAGRSHNFCRISDHLSGHTVCQELGSYSSVLDLIPVCWQCMMATMPNADSRQYASRCPIYANAAINKK